MKPIICALLLFVVPGLFASRPGVICRASGAAIAQAPKDIRDIFLTLPSPESVDTLFADSFTDPAGRKKLLDGTDFSSGKSILDLPNGYLKVDVFKQGEGSAAAREGFIVVTSFTKSNHDRLVVLQFTNLTDFPDSVIEDHYYLLSGGRYTKQEALQYLPKISLLGDFWGQQPLPDAAVQDYVKSSGDASFYDIEWPRRGTVAKAISRIPYSDTDTKEMERIQKVIGRRQYVTMELVWDKESGVFVKSAKTRNR